MRTRNRLNWAFFGGSMTMAALLGVLCHSELVFWSAAIGMRSYCQILWMASCLGGGLFHPIDKPYPGDDLCE